MSSEGLLNLKEAAKRLCMAQSTLRQYHKYGLYDFPQPYLYYGKKPQFAVEDLLKWKESHEEQVRLTRHNAVRTAHSKTDLVIDTERLISISEAAAICDISRRTIKNWLIERPADAPKAYRYRKNYLLFVLDDIKLWIEKRLAETYETRCALAANAREGKDG